MSLPLLSNDSKNIIKFFYSESQFKMSSATYQKLTQLMASWEDASRFVESQSATGLKIQTTNKLIPANGVSFRDLPAEIRNYITIQVSRKRVLTTLYSMRLKTRTVDIYIAEFDNMLTSKNMLAMNVLTWLAMIETVEPMIKQCGNGKLSVFFYMTPLCKTMGNVYDTLDRVHVNTAFTELCSNHDPGIIVVYRQEEAFKVFIHETMHTFGLDFAKMPQTAIKRGILDAFPIKSDVNLYESYAEIWARIMNVVFISATTGIKLAKLFDIECAFSVFQAVKVLNHMHLTYSDLIPTELPLNPLTNYRENTNVFAYYIVCAIIMVNISEFIEKWPIRFELTEQSALKFVDSIIKWSRLPKTMKKFVSAESVFTKTRAKFIKQTLRMTAFA